MQKCKKKKKKLESQASFACAVTIKCRALLSLELHVTLLVLGEDQYILLFAIKCAMYCSHVTKPKSDLRSVIYKMLVIVAR